MPFPSKNAMMMQKVLELQQVRNAQQQQQQQQQQKKLANPGASKKQPNETLKKAK